MRVNSTDEAHEPKGSGLRYDAVDISKKFSGVEVLKSVSVQFHAGEIHTLVGENGAGKSTLLKVMAGVYSPDGGSLSLGGVPQRGLTPREAQSRGIYLVPQEPRLMPDLSVAENLYVGALPKGRLLVNVDWRKVYASADAVFSRVGLKVNPRMAAGRLSIAQQQLVECARALAHDCRVIFFDEPTSPLTAHDSERLFELMNDLREQDLALGFISHRLDEVDEVSDRITVLRDGGVVAEAERGELTRQELVGAMVGRSLAVTQRAQHAETPGEVALDVQALSCPPEVNGFTLQVRSGEIVGLAGLVGSGRTEFAEAVFGLRSPTAGRVKLGERDITARSPRGCIDAGLVYLAEDRGRNGVFADVDIARNVTAATIGRLPKWIGTFLRPRQEQLVAQQAAQQMDVRAASMELPIKALSGGNQQRALLARWVAAAPKVAIFDEPTRGVDVGAKEGIYEIIESLTRNGLAALVISSELEELVRLCDRVYAVYEGRVVGEVTGDDITLENLGHLAVGAQ
ncbi:sugar ABC transporter ATP-binding protein [Rugosimonospora acidiphila]|uniref:sugar ABC transporter ATP-binding protein n=1 Tax=Rugosimonospora acidiphila TaxID=556531 RepID=UPI0031F1175B